MDENFENTFGNSGFVSGGGTADVTGEYSHLELLSRTGVCFVWRAMRYGRWYALKGLSPEHSRQEMYRQMLLKEFNIMMRLPHDGVSRAVEFADIPGAGQCIVMDWIEGDTLDSWLASSPSRARQRRVFGSLLSSLAAIHSSGVVHRDLKPENVMVTCNGEQAVVIDFGLADTDQHATLKQPAGTRQYAAPEQIAAHDADTRNDIYSLGVIARQMNLGRGWQRAAFRCLRPIDERWQSVEQFQQALAGLRQFRRKAALAAITVLLIALLTALALVTTRLRSSETRLHATNDSLKVALKQIGDLSGRQQQLNDSQQRLNDSLGTVSAVNEQVQQSQQRLNDSLGIVASAGQRVEQLQQQEQQSKKTLADAVAEGKRVIDKAVIASHIVEHIDTLSAIRYENPNYQDMYLSGYEALNGYVASLNGKLDDKQLSSLNQQLTDYLVTKWIAPITDKYSKLKY